MDYAPYIQRLAEQNPRQVLLLDANVILQDFIGSNHRTDGAKGITDPEWFREHEASVWDATQAYLHILRSVPNISPTDATFDEAYGILQRIAPLVSRDTREGLYSFLEELGTRRSIYSLFLEGFQKRHTAGLQLRTLEKQQTDSRKLMSPTDADLVVAAYYFACKHRWDHHQNSVAIVSHDHDVARGSRIFMENREKFAERYPNAFGDPQGITQPVKVYRRILAPTAAPAEASRALA